MNWSAQIYPWVINTVITFVVLKFLNWVWGKSREIFRRKRINATLTRTDILKWCLEPDVLAFVIAVLTYWSVNADIFQSGVQADKANNGAQFEAASPFSFSASDIIDLPAFTRDISDQSNLVSSLLRKGFADGVNSSLEDYSNTRTNAQRLQCLLAEGLNKVVAGPLIFEKNEFKDVSLRPKTAELLKHAPQGDELRKLNQMLLEDAFPRALSRNHAESDLIYVVVATVLVYFMQFGFIAFEAGAAYTTYGFESAVKNLLVFIVAYFAYMLLGWHIQKSVDPSFLAFLPESLGKVFSAGFASTAALIVANTVTGRTSIPANLALSFVSAGIGYPFLAGFMWGGGWLHQRGFVDGAGGCVVHLFAGCVGLFAAYRIGPTIHTQGWCFLERPSKPDQRPLVPLTVLGGLFLWFGWLGFNSGTASGENAFFKALLNTSLGACGGGLAAILSAILPRLAKTFFKNRPVPRVLREMADPERVLIGILAGLVCVTANASHVSSRMALAESSVAGLAVMAICVLVSSYAVRFDDPLAAVATHAGAGFIGIGIFNSLPQCGNHPRLLVQLTGCGIAITSAWILSWLACGFILAVDWLALGQAKGLAPIGVLLQNFRLRLSASHQIAGQMRSGSWGLAAEAAHAIKAVESTTLPGTWMPAVGKLAMTHIVPPDAAKALVDKAIHMMESTPNGEPAVRQALAAIAIFPQNNKLRECLEDCFERLTKHGLVLHEDKEPTPTNAAKGWTHWNTIDSGSSMFSVQDIADVKGLLDKLRDKSNLFSNWLFLHFDRGFQRRLARNMAQPQDLNALLVVQLNKLVSGQLVNEYKKDILSIIKPSPPTEDLLAKQPKGKELVRLNRLLIADAYRPALSSRLHGESEFSVNDITDLQGLLQKLKSKSDLFSYCLFHQFDEGFRKQLATGQPSTVDAAALVLRLNNVLSNEYQKAIFGVIHPRPQTRQLLASQPNGKELFRLNRLILEDTYSKELSQSLDPHYREVLIWAIATLTDRFISEELVMEDDADGQSINEDLPLLRKSREFFKWIGESTNEAPMAKELACGGLKDLVNSKIYTRI